MNDPATIGLLSFLSFAFSIIAAVLAIDMYKLLRTGEFGKTWRLLIIASVMFALLQVLRVAEILNWRAINESHLAQIVELCFVIVLAYAFYLQRSVFTAEHRTAPDGDDEKLTADDYPLAAEPELEDDDDIEETVSPHWPSVHSLDTRR